VDSFVQLLVQSGSGLFGPTCALFKIVRFAGMTVIWMETLSRPLCRPVTPHLLALETAVPVAGTALWNRHRRELVDEPHRGRVFGP